jgi:hypothetical protein
MSTMTPSVSLLIDDEVAGHQLHFELTPEFEAKYELKPLIVDSAKRNTKRIGDISELHAIVALTKMGYKVLLPFGENQRYDFVVDDGQTLSRIQVKTGRLRNGVILYGAASTHGHRGRPCRPYRGEVEYFAVYCPDTEKVYLVPESHLTRSIGSLRVAPTKNNVQKTVRWASTYELA